jgi:copper resistance protein B
MREKWLWISILGGAAGLPLPAQAQQPMGGMQMADPMPLLALPPPIDDRQIQFHGILDQLEDRTTGASNNFRYEGQMWAGTDYDKLYLKFEGLRQGTGKYSDGLNELLYSRAISTYFDLQTGIRVDLDGGTARTWYALGVQGLAVQFFKVEATAYVSDEGHFATKLNASYDITITNRLFLQPQAELNIYSKSDPGRGVGAGVSELDTGLRLRYEVTRKFAPYIGVVYQHAFGQTGRFSRSEGESVSDVRLVFGVRTWF